MANQRRKKKRQARYLSKMKTLTKDLPEAKFTITPAHTRSEHYYEVGDPYAVRLFSITGFIGWLGGPKVGAIKGWTIKMTAERAFQYLNSEDMTQDSERALIARGEIKRAAKQELDRTATLGNEIHRFAELTALGQKPLMKNFDKEIHESIRAFKEWWKGAGLTPVAAELRVANPEVGFAGTLDLLASNKEGKLCLIDYKSSAAMHKETKMQLAACNNGLFHTYGIAADVLQVVRVGRDGGAVEVGTMHPDEEPLSWALFKNLVDLKKKYEALGDWQ